MKTPKTYAKNVTISLGLASSVGSLKPLRSSERADSFNTLCPGCLEEGIATRVEQRYICSRNHGPFLPGDCQNKGKQVGDELIPLSQEDIDAIRELSESNNQLSLNVHPADQVNMIPTGKAYAFLPHSTNDPFYGVLKDLVSEPDLVFMGTFIQRGRENVYRLAIQNDILVLAELCRPNEMYEYAPVEAEYDPKYLRMAITLVEGIKSDFDPELYIDRTFERLETVLAAKDSGTPIPARPKPAEKLDDIEAALRASLDAMTRSA